jgi:hypothetical protein
MKQSIDQLNKIRTSLIDELSKLLETWSRDTEEYPDGDNGVACLSLFPLLYIKYGSSTIYKGLFFPTAMSLTDCSTDDLLKIKSGWATMSSAENKRLARKLKRLSK